MKLGKNQAIRQTKILNKALNKLEVVKSIRIV